MTDDYAETLSAERSNENALLLEILESDYESWTRIIAIEGRDDKAFYFDYCKAALPNEEIHFLDCGGKDRLLRFKVVAEKYRWSREPEFRYICDKDFDDFNEGLQEGLWYTSLYSIESYLVSAEYVQYEVERSCLSTITMDERAEFIGRYSEILQSMVQGVRSYCAYISLVRATGEHPQFDDFGIECLFALEKAEIARRPHTLRAAKDALKIKSSVSCSSLLQRNRLFARTEPLQWVRGKLYLQMAKKSYDLAKRGMKRKLQEKLPAPNFLGAGGLARFSAFCRALPGLEEYLL